jgi:small-conductance mechanosensitive channel
VPAFWQHVAVAAVVAAAALALARLVDWRIARLQLAPEAITRYRVLRRTVVGAIAFVGVLSALLVIPQVRAVAGGILASSALVGIVVGFASQRTIGNAVAGVLIAFTQPLRLGDTVEVDGRTGVVEEIGLTYTWLRTAGDDRIVVPNEHMVSVPLRNATIRSDRASIEVTVGVPLDCDLRRAVSALAGGSDEVYLSGLTEKGEITVRRWIPRSEGAERAASALRLDVAERLKVAGLLA